MKKITYPLFISFSILIVGCSPKPTNRADCFLEASKAPTEQGVRAGLQACNLKFPQ